MKITAVFHGKKIGGVKHLDPRIAANPPMNMDGMQQILSLVPEIRDCGNYVAIFSSIVSRALCAASVIAQDMGFEEIETLSRLGQFANLDDDGTIITYPGHEGDNYMTWQRDGLSSVASMYDKYPHCQVIAVSHRPIIGGLVAAARGVTDEKGIEAIVHDKKTSEKGFVVFDFDGKNLSLIG